MKLNSIGEQVAAGVLLSIIVATGTWFYGKLVAEEPKPSGPRIEVAATPIRVEFPNFNWNITSNGKLDNEDPITQAIAKIAMRQSFSVVRYEISNADDVIHRDAEIKVDSAEFLLTTDKNENTTLLPKTGSKVDLLPKSTFAVTAIQTTSQPSLSLIVADKFFPAESSLDLAKKQGAFEADKDLRAFNFVIPTYALMVAPLILWFLGMAVFQWGAHVQWNKVKPLLDTADRAKQLVTLGSPQSEPRNTP